MFEVAYFWHIDPGVVLAMPLSRAHLYEQQAERIAEAMRPKDR